MDRFCRRDPEDIGGVSTRVSDVIKFDSKESP